MRMCVALFTAIVSFWPHGLIAQEYPARPVRVVVPFAAGAGTDLTGRIVAQELSKRLGQQFFVENKPGGAAQFGTSLVAKAEPDGYTLLWTVTDGLSVLPAVKASLPYAVPDDFAFIGSIAQQPYTLTAHPRWNFKTLADLVAYAKANPGKLNFGSAGLGSAPHLTIAMIANTSGVQMVHVPFGGLGPATNALVAATVDVGLVIPVQAKQLIETGRVRGLAVTGETRSRVLPDVPTLIEQGLKETSIVAYGLTAPAKTDAPIVAHLCHVMGEMMKDPAFTEQLTKLGFELLPLIGDQYRDFIVKDLERWRTVAKIANIKIEN